HLAETDAGFEHVDFLAVAVLANVDVERAFDADVERVSAPLAFAHDLFAGVVGEESDIRPDPFAVTVVAPLDDHFEIGGVFLFAVLFFEEFSGKSEILDGFNNATPIGNFAWHLVVYTSVSSVLPSTNRSQV